MPFRFDRVPRVSSFVLGAAALAGAGVLFVWDVSPGLFPFGTHDVLAAFSLAAIACAYLVHQIMRRPAGMDFAKSVLLAAAFLFWAANQFWPNLPQATLFNDIAIGLFVLDIFLVMTGWPPPPSPESPVASACVDFSNEKQR
ncbi:MAG TPA: hypothetical protein VGF96_18910 [Terracidiphilus sp.]|jgi:hypothetical protein